MRRYKLCSSGCVLVHCLVSQLLIKLSNHTDFMDSVCCSLLRDNNCEMVWINNQKTISEGEFWGSWPSPAWIILIPFVWGVGLHKSLLIIYHSQFVFKYVPFEWGLEKIELLSSCCCCLINKTLSIVYDDYFASRYVLTSSVMSEILLYTLPRLVTTCVGFCFVI